MAGYRHARQPVGASQFIATLERRQGLKIACIEEIAWRNGFIDSEQMDKLATPLSKTGYGQYLKRLLIEGKRSEEMFMRRQGDLQNAETVVQP